MQTSLPFSSSLLLSSGSSFMEHSHVLVFFFCHLCQAHFSPFVDGFRLASHFSLCANPSHFSLFQAHFLAVFMDVQVCLSSLLPHFNYNTALCLFAFFALISFCFLMVFPPFISFLSNLFFLDPAFSFYQPGKHTRQKLYTNERTNGGSFIQALLFLLVKLILEIK